MSATSLRTKTIITWEQIVQLDMKKQALEFRINWTEKWREETKKGPWKVLEGTDGWGGGGCMAFISATPTPRRSQNWAMKSFCSLTNCSLRFLMMVIGHSRPDDLSRPRQVWFYRCEIKFWRKKASNEQMSTVVLLQLLKLTSQCICQLNYAF